MKKTHIILIVFLAIVVAAVVSMYGDTSQYSTFTDAIEHPDQEHQIVGYLVQGKEYEYDPVKDPNRFAFYCTDKEGKEMKVVHFEKPEADIYKTDQLTMFGKVENGEFHTSKILYKCPSKIENDSLTGAETAAN